MGAHPLQTLLSWRRLNPVKLAYITSSQMAGSINNQRL